MSETSEITGPLIKALNQTGGMAMRMPVGKLRVGRHYVQMHDEGTADILFFPKQVYVHRPEAPVWIETKDPQGTTAKKRKEMQAHFRARVEALGHKYILCKSIAQGLEEALA